jgi:metallo-beta-lactamase class B
MKRVPALLVASLSVALLGAAVMAQAPTSGAAALPQAEIDTHMAAARAAAGMDFRNTFLNLCLAPAARGGGAAGRGAAAEAGARGAAAAGAAGQAAPARGADPAAAGRGGAAGRAGAGQAAGGRGGEAQTQNPNTYAPPFKIFDNLYWLGTRAHSSWALQTSDGIVIIDTNFAWATEPEIIGGLTKLGLNPRDIKYVIISHAHGDHDQGAAELQKRFGAKVVMGVPDWESTLQRPATAAGGVPTKDIAVGPEGYKLTLGDTTVQIVATPGHTPGTLSYVFPVKHQGQPLMVAYSGGTLTGGFGTNGARWDEYVNSQRKIAKVAGDAGARVILSNHSEYDGAYTRARLIAAPRQAGEDHPFILGPEAVQRYFTVMAECATAQKLRNGAK